MKNNYQDPLHARLLDGLQSAFQALYGQAPAPAAILFQPTRAEFEGDVTINVFPFLKLSGQGPEQTATAVGAHLQAALPFVEKFNVVKGFLNVVVADAYWTEFLGMAVERDLLQFPSTGEQVMVEYSSPNTNKPLHLGHLRNNFLGHAVSRILSATGNDVVRVQIINDRGIHICKSMVAWLRYGEGETPDSSGLKGDKLVGNYYVAFDRAYKEQVAAGMAAGLTEEEAGKQAPIMCEAQEMLRKWEDGDPEVRALWERMNGWVYAGFDETYAAMGVEFDKLYHESETYLLGRKDVLDGLERGIFFRKADGSVWVDLTAEGLDEKLLLRGDGTSVYITQDVGTAIQRFKEFPALRRMIYTVGNEQDYHFKVLFLVLKKLGYPWADELYHLSYGMVDLPTGRMKSREGTVVDADDLIAEVVSDAAKATTALGKLEDLDETARKELFRMIGLAALKYYLLKVDPRKRMLFDPQASIDLQGHTGPFIQYTYARIQSLLRKADPGDTAADAGTAGAWLPEERTVIKLLHQLPAVLADTAQRLEPSALANHTYELVKAYNSFYQSVPVLREEDAAKRARRLKLGRAVGQAVKKSMWCLGIEVPERM